MDPEQTTAPVSFAAAIYKLGINPCVDVPERVSKAFGRRGFVPVEATLHGHTFRVTLVPRGGGRHRLFINGEMRKTAGVDTGDTVHTGLCLDTKSRDIPVPEDLREALRARSGARKAFDELPPSHRKELLRWVLDAKRPETRRPPDSRHLPAWCLVCIDGRTEVEHLMPTSPIGDKHAPAACACCGAVVPGGSEGCRKLFEDLLVLEYSDPSYGAVHLLTVDAYALQHPEGHGPRSNAYHLIRLCWLLEHGGDARMGQAGPRSKALAEGYRDLPDLEPPEHRGEVTVADVHGAAGAEAHADRVKQWASSVWRAWTVHQEWAREWVRRL